MAKGELVLTLDDRDVINANLDYLKEFFGILFQGGNLPLRSINSLVYEAENKLTAIQEIMSRRQAFILQMERLKQEGCNIDVDNSSTT